MALRPGDRQLIKEWNEALVLDTIRRHEPVTRVELAERTGLGRSTITVITGRLIRQGLVQEVGSLESPDPGRRPTLLRLRARAMSVLGIKLGPEQVTVGVVDLHGEVCHTVVRPLTQADGDRAVVATLLAAVREAAEGASDELGPLLGAGLVMPGVVDPETGATINPYVADWAGLPLRQVLEEALQVPVLVDNDANAVALAERWHGAGRGAETLLCLTVGVGIGAGLIVGGRLHRGFRYGAGEIGHSLVAPDGPLCRCGRRGCLEALAGDAGLERRSGLPREELIRRAQAGDPEAVRHLREAGELIGVAIANAVNLISPDRVVVGGEALLQAGELLLEPIRRAVAGQAFPVMADLPVVPAELGQAAWVRGAALLVLEQAFRVPINRRDETNVVLVQS
ncbi:MAG: ROK family transcriptional regulator [Bacillota bacterium]